MQTYRMKKGLKIGLIIGTFILIVLLVGIGLNKMGIIPSWCRIKCSIGCGCVNCPIIMGWSCSNNCEKMCDVPKYEKCILKCKKPDVEGYDERSYDMWYMNSLNGWANRGYTYYGNYDVVLSNNDRYEDWINEVFSGYQEELKKYESCKSTCGTPPSYILYN